METLKVIEIIDSPSAISPRKGVKAYDYVEALISNGQEVNLTFEGVQDMTQSFCNAFFGKLYMTYPQERLESLLHWNGIPENHIWLEKIKEAILLGTDEKARTAHSENLANLLAS